MSSDEDVPAPSPSAAVLARRASRKVKPMREESGSDEDAQEPEDWEDDDEASSERTIQYIRAGGCRVRWRSGGSGSQTWSASVPGMTATRAAPPAQRCRRSVVVPARGSALRRRGGGKPTLWPSRARSRRPRRASWPNRWRWYCQRVPLACLWQPDCLDGVILGGKKPVILVYLH